MCQISLLRFRNVCPGSDSRVKTRKAKQVQVVQWVLKIYILFLSSKRYADIRFMVNITTAVICSHTGLNCLR